MSGEYISYWACRLLLYLVFKITPGFFICVCVCVCMYVCVRQSDNERWGLESGINNGAKEHQSQERVWFGGELCMWICVFMCLNLIKDAPYKTDWFGSVDFIDFYSYCTELQGSHCVEKTRRTDVLETMRNNRGLEKQADKAAFITPIISICHIIFSKDHRFN